jgi:hypothetical protein
LSGAKSSEAPKAPRRADSTASTANGTSFSAQRAIQEELFSSAMSQISNACMPPRIHRDEAAIKIEHRDTVRTPLDQSGFNFPILA